MLPLLNGSRERVELHATPAVMRQIAAALNKALRVAAPDAARKANARIIDPVKLAAYEAAFADWQNHTCRTQRDAARKHGLPFSAFVRWLHRLPETPAPYLKPNGEIL